MEEVTQYTISRNPAPIFDGVNMFGFDEGAFVLKDGEASSIDLAMPKNLSATENPVAEDFTISFDSSNIQLNDNSVEVSDNTLTFEVESDGIDNKDIIVSVIHEPTGLVASAAPRSELTEVNGFYEIYYPSDLVQIAEGFNNSSLVSTFKAANYKLCADIDMTGYSLPLMATSEDDAFTGHFIGADNDGGKYTISNLTITGTSTPNDDNPYPVGLFCYANGAVFKNFALENVTVTNSGRGTALLVGYADSNSETSCEFNDIDVNNCSVISTYNCKLEYLTEEEDINYLSEVGALVGSVRSTSEGYIYSFENITITGTTITIDNDGINSDIKNIGYAVGGLIGYSGAAGTVVIGTPEGGNISAPSIVIDGLSIYGYAFLGGVIGLAGALPNTITTNAMISHKGGIVINNVIVKNNSSVTAIQGYVGGILGSEGCETEKAKIINLKK